MSNIKACRMTSLDWFFDDFLKISKDRDHSVSGPAKKLSGLHLVKSSLVSGFSLSLRMDLVVLSYFGRVLQIF